MSNRADSGRPRYGVGLAIPRVAEVTACRLLVGWPPLTARGQSRSPNSSPWVRRSEITTHRCQLARRARAWRILRIPAIPGRRRGAAGSRVGVDQAGAVSSRDRVARPGQRAGGAVPSGRWTGGARRGVRFVTGSSRAFGRRCGELTGPCWPDRRRCRRAWRPTGSEGRDSSVSYRRRHSSVAPWASLTLIKLVRTSSVDFRRSPGGSRVFPNVFGEGALRGTCDDSKYIAQQHIWETANCWIGVGVAHRDGGSGRFESPRCAFRASR
jgi:hypothetical protein